MADLTKLPPALSRRQALTALGLIATLPSAARAAEWLHDPVVFYADNALRPVLERLGARYQTEHGVLWRVYAAAPRNSLGLLATGTQDDILITLTNEAAQAEARGLIAPGRLPLWRNTLVFAALGAAQPAAEFTPQALLAALGGGKLAVTDPTPSATFNGLAVLDRAGLGGLLRGHVQGAINTEQAAGMLHTGDATVALLHASEAATLPGLRTLMAVPPSAYDPITYDVALTKSAWSRNQDRVITFLRALPADTLAGLGLEPIA